MSWAPWTISVMIMSRNKNIYGITMCPFLVLQLKKKNPQKTSREVIVLRLIRPKEEDKEGGGGGGGRGGGRRRQMMTAAFAY